MCSRCLALKLPGSISSSHDHVRSHIVSRCLPPSTPHTNDTISFYRTPHCITLPRHHVPRIHSCSTCSNYLVGALQDEDKEAAEEAKRQARRGEQMITYAKRLELKLDALYELPAHLARCSLFEKLQFARDHRAMPGPLFAVATQAR